MSKLDEMKAIQQAVEILRNAGLEVGVACDPVWLKLWDASNYLNSRMAALLAE